MSNACKDEFNGVNGANFVAFISFTSHPNKYLSIILNKFIILVKIGLTESIALCVEFIWFIIPFKLNFTTYIRLDLMMRNPDTVEYLQKSGLKSAVFGIETINHNSGKSIGKGLDPIEQFQFIEEIKKNEFKEILTYSGFILGLPKDREDELERLEEFLFSEKNKLDDFTVEPLFITPPHINHISHKDFSEFVIRIIGFSCNILFI